MLLPAVVSAGALELPEDCINLLKEEVFSIQTIREFIQSGDPVHYLENVVRCACKQSEDCNMDTLPLEAIVEEIIFN